MSAENDNKDNKPQYEAPKLMRVSLRPEEAVLGHCKISSSSGPVAPSCTAIACRTVGS